MRTHLTKTEKMVLETLQNNPDAKVHKGWIDLKEYLIVDGNWTTLRSNAFNFHYVQVALEKLPYNGRQNEEYTIKPNAQISVEWINNEHQKIDAERKAKSDREKQAKLEAEQALENRLSRLAYALTQQGENGPTITFNKWYIELEFEGYKYHIDEVTK